MKNREWVAAVARQVANQYFHDEIASDKEISAAESEPYTPTPVLFDGELVSELVHDMITSAHDELLQGIEEQVDKLNKRYFS